MYLNGKINDLINENDQLRGKLGDTQEKLDVMTNDRNDLDQQLRQLREEVSRWEIKYNECEKNCELTIKNKELEMEALKQDLEKKEKRMRTELDRLLKESLMEHEEQVQMLMQELEELRKKFDEKIKFYEDQYRELQMCFEGRPSRPDDIELINNLQKELNGKNEELQLAEERMKFFRQELINREDNYNKIFNANPIVGTMNPLMQKKNSGIMQSNSGDPRGMGNKNFPSSSKTMARQSTMGGNIGMGINGGGMNMNGGMGDMPMIGSQNSIMKSRK